MPDRQMWGRAGRNRPEGPFEGVPPHLRQPISHWLHRSLTEPNRVHFKDQLMQDVIAAARVVPPSGLNAKELFTWMVNCIHEDEEEFLDIVHAAVQLVTESSWRRDLSRTLELGDSVWQATERGLERRVSTDVTRAFDRATLAGDAESVELTEAWARAFGRNPNPSDAWDHAIKAVETVLIPLVVRDVEKATLGRVIERLEDKKKPPFALLLAGRDGSHSVEPLIQMLRLMWPNPDRHGGSPTNSRQPSVEEAQAIVQLAVTIVQWGREGVVGQQ